ncbi:MAG TPA: hypothetical protein VIM89_11810 [Mucilaginibacter sp.]
MLFRLPGGALPVCVFISVLLINPVTLGSSLGWLFLSNSPNKPGNSGKALRKKIPRERSEQGRFFCSKPEGLRPCPMCPAYENFAAEKASRENGKGYKA